MVTVKLSKTWLPKIIKSDGFLVKLSGPLILLGLTVAVSAADAVIHGEILEPGTSGDSESFTSGITSLFISEKEIKDILEIVKSLKDYGVLIRSSNWNFRKQ